MRTARRAIAAAEIVLIAPAALFMAALLLRNIPPPNDPTNVFQHLVMWYAGHHWTLWALLLALPLVVVVTGGAILLQAWTDDRELRNAVGAIRAHSATFLLAATTLTAAGTLVFIVLHMLAN